MRVNVITMKHTVAAGADAYAIDIWEAEAAAKLSDLQKLLADVPDDLAELLKQYSGLQLTQSELDELRKRLDYLLEKQFNRPSSSPFAAPILFTPKTDGGFHMCIDYRILNRVAIKSCFPIPRADELIDQLRTAQVFLKIDLRGGYHQIRVKSPDCSKTAFRTCFGSFEYMVMPFGLTNAPATFQMTMNEDFRQLLDKCAIVYLDDILIYNLSNLYAIVSLGCSGVVHIGVTSFSTSTTAASAVTAASDAPTATSSMASPTVLTFDAEGRAVDFDVWVDDLQLFLQCDSKDGVSLFYHTSSVSPAPAATADSTVCSQWTTRDAVARLAIRTHSSSPATTALSCLMLLYLFLDLAAFATVADLITHLRTSDARYRAALPTEFYAKNPPPMYITLYYLVTRLPDSLTSVRDHFPSLCPTELTVDLLEERLTTAEKSILAVGASRGDPRAPFFEGCSPVPLLPSVASAAAIDLVGTEEVRAASAPSGRRRNSKGKGGKGGGGDGGAGVGGGGGGGGGGGEGGGGGGSGGFGGGGEGGGGSGSGGGGSGSNGGGGGSSGGGPGPGGAAQRGGFGGSQRQQQPRSRETPSA
ncbi:unnamed protein product [Closterium sp. NIES-53]